MAKEPEPRLFQDTARMRAARLEEERRDRASAEVQIVKHQRFDLIPASGKIYDITHADTNEHSVALPAAYPANTKALIVYGDRQGGTGMMALISISGTASAQWRLRHQYSGVWVRAADGLFYYELTTAGDDWDIYAVGYVVG